MLIHQLSSCSHGKFNELEDDFRNSEMMMEDIYNLYLEHTSMTKEELVEQMKHDSWWRIGTCIEKGLVDEVYE